MALTPQHTYQVLTKRADRMQSYTLAACRLNRNIGGQAVAIALDDGRTEFAGISTTHPIKAGEVREGAIDWAYQGFPNVDLGVSVENQEWADKRREAFRATTAGRKFVSYEPALGPVDWRGWEFVDQIISGGESGPRARPTHPDWHRATRDFCAAHGIAYFFKQWGEWMSILDRDADDPDWRAPYVRYERSPRHEFLNVAGGCGFHGDSLHVMHRVGKKAAGRALDGVQHDGMPA
jgi:protein gp37